MSASYTPSDDSDDSDDDDEEEDDDAGGGGIRGNGGGKGGMVPPRAAEAGNSGAGECLRFHPHIVFIKSTANCCLSPSQVPPAPPTSR